MWEVAPSTDESLMSMYGGNHSGVSSTNNSPEHASKPIHARGRLDSTITSESDRLTIIKDISKRMSVTLQEAVSRAASVACSLHEMIEGWEDTRLKLHAGIGCGDCFGQVIGGVLGRWEFVLTGEGVEQIASAEPAAGPTETVVSPQSWEYLKQDFEGEPVDKAEFAEMNLIRIIKEKDTTTSVSKDIGSHDAIQLKSKHISFMPTYLPNAVIMNLKAGVCDSTSQAEMRDLSVMFVQLANLDTGDNARTQSAIECVQEATYQVSDQIELTRAHRNPYTFEHPVGATKWDFSIFGRLAK